MMHVVAGVLVDAEGRVLVAQRPPGKHLAGFWEFPGGKVEPGETAHAALVRELEEELGIAADPSTFTPVVRVAWDKGDRPISLEAIRVSHWSGEVQPLDASALEWLHPAEMSSWALAPADIEVLKALTHP